MAIVNCEFVLFKKSYSGKLHAKILSIQAETFRICKILVVFLSVFVGFPYHADVFSHPRILAIMQIFFSLPRILAMERKIWVFTLKRKKRVEKE